MKTFQITLKTKFDSYGRSETAPAGVTLRSVSLTVNGATKLSEAIAKAVEVAAVAFPDAQVSGIDASESERG